MPKANGKSCHPKWMCLFLMVSVILTCATSFGTEERRHAVFEYSTGKDYPDYEATFFNAITIDFFINPSGDLTCHFPCTLFVSYDDTNCYADNDSFAMNFWIEPFDGPGLEFEWEQGVKVDVDYTIYYHSWQAGKDFNEDFVPPMTGDTISMYSEQAPLADWGCQCVGGIGAGFYAGEEFLGDSVKIWLDISTPGDKSKVKFQDTGDRYSLLKLTHRGEPVTKYIDIDFTYLGDKIVVEAWPGYTPTFNFDRWTSDFLPGISAWIHKIPWDCHPWWRCRCYHEETRALEWYSGVEDDAAIDLDGSESEEIKFEVACDRERSAYKKAQDLIAEIKRLLNQHHPNPGLVDRLETEITNLYDNLRVPYDSVRIEYALQTASTPAAIGWTTIAGTEWKLADFNAGTASSIKDTFDFAPGNPEYVFDKEQCWYGLDPYPRYIATIVPYPDPDSLVACPDWHVASAVPGIGPNDRALAALEPPLPDFSIDSLYIGAPFCLEFGDLCSLCVRVTNQGIDWPVAGTPAHPADYVTLRGRVFYTGLTPRGDTAYHWDELGEDTITPLANGEHKTYCYEYVVPGPDETMSDSDYPIDVRVVFEVNGGRVPVDSAGWAVWELDFLDNTVVCDLALTDMPDLAIPSDIRYNVPDSIEARLPLVCCDTVATADDQWRYLYVSDPDFVYPDAMPEMRVEMGSGPHNTSPRDTTWIWQPCIFDGDYTDSAGVSYKVYKANGTLLCPPTVSPQSYCFRASLDWCHVDSPAVFLYVDSDGASPDETVYDQTDTLSTANVYYLDNAGLLEARSAGVGAGDIAGRVILVGTGPNPASLPVRIEYELSRECDFDLSIYDVRGRRVAVLVRGFLQGGGGVAEWDGRNEKGRAVSSGIYFCRLSAGSYAQTAKILLLR
jgi:hypothetical protein